MELSECVKNAIVLEIKNDKLDFKKIKLCAVNEFISSLDYCVTRVMYNDGKILQQMCLSIESAADKEIKNNPVFKKMNEMGLVINIE